MLRLQFEATVVVPPYSPDVYNGSNVQAIWPGVQSPGGLIQNVVASSPGPVNGPIYWIIQPFYCCTYVLKILKMKVLTLKLRPNFYDIVPSSPGEKISY
jgi:hypothetical protein